MRSERTSAQAAASVAAAIAGLRPAPVAHVERFIAVRALETSRAIIHPIGATRAYHGHAVSSEWQFRQARARIAATGGGTLTLTSNDCQLCTGPGFVSGLATPPTTTAAPSAAATVAISQP